jgi:hypothetical protein
VPVLILGGKISVFNSSRSSCIKLDTGLVNYLLYIRLKAMHILNLQTLIFSNHGT